MDMDKAALDRYLTSGPNDDFTLWVERLWDKVDEADIPAKTYDALYFLFNDWENKLFQQGHSPEAARTRIIRTYNLYLSSRHNMRMHTTFLTVRQLRLLVKIGFILFKTEYAQDTYIGSYQVDGDAYLKILEGGYPLNLLRINTIRCNIFPSHIIRSIFICEVLLKKPKAEAPTGTAP